jgi:hypothetical protein
MPDKNLTQSPIPVQVPGTTSTIVPGTWSSTTTGAIGIVPSYDTTPKPLTPAAKYELGKAGPKFATLRRT